MLIEGNRMIPIPATVDELILSPDMAGKLMTPEESDTADVDPDDGSRYEHIHGVVTEHETYTTPLLPGFELPLARLFAAADDWK
jgi:hypothetical protein